MTITKTMAGIVGIVIIAISAVATLLITGVINNPLANDAQSELVEERRAQALGYAESLVLTDLGKQLLKESEPEALNGDDFDEACSGVNVAPGVGVLGCYYAGRDKIYIYDVTDPRLVGIEPVVLAHELLHAAWERLDSEDQMLLNKRLLDTFTGLPADHPVVIRLLPYIESAPDSLYTELHSIMGTEALELPADLEAHYAKYFEEREQIARDANSAYGVIDGLRDEVQTFAEELIARETELEDERKRLSQNEIDLEIEIRDFNALAENGGFASEIEYNLARDELEEKQVKLSEEYDTFNESIKQYNSDVSRLEELNSTLQELNEGVNIPARQ